MSFKSIAIFLSPLFPVSPPEKPLLHQFYKIIKQVPAIKNITPTIITLIYIVVGSDID